MKTRLLALAALILWGASAFAQEDIDPPFSPYFTLEIGTGMAPLHTLLNGEWALGYSLSEDGTIADAGHYWCPSFSVSAAWHTTLKWEWVVTAGFSWVHHRMLRYDSFGIDPEGRPRFDSSSPHDDGTGDSLPAPVLFAQARRFWNPTQKVKLYSAVGIGYVSDPSKAFGVVPSLTPIAVRFGTGHLKFFIENAITPAATILDLGLGWSF
jgi:hypothetical protein